MLQATGEWKLSYPRAHAGLLAIREAANPAAHDGLNAEKAALEAMVRERYAGKSRADLVQDPILRAYADYYRTFDKTYHVQGQLESIAWKGKSIPGVAALVEAMFMAEVDNLLLTAGHDLDLVRGSLTLDVARGGESYTLMRGAEQTLKPGDMYIRDEAGILSSILYGPDRRTAIRPETRSAVFTVYAPEGVPADRIHGHLEDIRRYAALLSPALRVEKQQVVGAE